MGKKIFKIVLIVIAILLIVAILGVLIFLGILFSALFSACQDSGTMLEGANPPRASVLMQEEERYLKLTLYGSGIEYLFDTEENRLISIEPTNLTHVYRTRLVDDRIEKDGFVCIPVYDTNTGAETRRDYYRGTVIIDCSSGKELEREVDQTPMTEAEVEEFLLEVPEEEELLPSFLGIEGVANFTLTNGLSRHEEPFDPEPLNETERAIYEYSYGLVENKSHFYSISTSSRRIGGEVWFCSTYNNKKNWGGQRPVKSGLQSSCLVKYNEATQRFSSVLELGEGSVILGFNGTYAIYYDNGALYRYTHATGETVMLTESESDLYAQASRTLLFLEYYGENTRLVVMRYDGTVVYEK